MPTAPQLRAIHTVRRRVFDSDDTYRAFLLVTFPHKQWRDASRPSTTELDVREAIRCLDALMRLHSPQQQAARRPAPAPTPQPHPWKHRYTGTGRRGAGKHLTQAQADEIARLEYTLGWQSRPERLVGFIARQLGAETRKTPEMLTRREATAVITGLRRYIASPRQTA